MKTLLLHTPKLEDFYLPFGRYMNVNYMPMGMLAIAAHLNGHGHQTSVVHVGIEKILDPNWSVSQQALSWDVAAVGLSLHWHYQAYDVAMAVERIRAARPDLFIFIGGITASYFGAEVLDTIPGADAVILGEGLEPARQLVEALDKKAVLDTVPNLVWRKGERIVTNPTRILHEAALLDSVSFADFAPLQNNDSYVQQFGFPLAYAWELSPEENRKMMTMGRSFFPLMVGSGCPRVCSFCCGNAVTQKRINAGHRLYFRSMNAIMDDVRQARDAGYRTMALCFDPMPKSTPFFVELFGRMKRETPDMDLYFECWSLPEPAFIQAFADAFNAPHSYLALSPDTGNDAIRKKNKGYYYSNEQLLATADSLLEHEIQMDIFFSIGFSGETMATALDTRDLMRRMAERYENIRRLMVWAVQLEPGSPAFDDPGKWDIVSSRSTLADFVQAHGSRGDAYTVLGYKIPDFFGDERDLGRIEEFEQHMQQFKCMEFCFHAKDPRVYNHPLLGRQECLEKRRILASRRGQPAPGKIISAEYPHHEALRAERPDVERIEV